VNPLRESDLSISFFSVTAFSTDYAQTPAVHKTADATELLRAGYGHRTGSLSAAKRNSSRSERFKAAGRILQSHHRQSGPRSHGIEVTSLTQKDYASPFQRVFRGRFLRKEGLRPITAAIERVTGRSEARGPALVFHPSRSAGA